MARPKITLNTDSHFSFRVPDKQREYLRKLWTPPTDTSADGIMLWLYNRGLIQNYVRKLEYDDVDSETIEDMIQEIWLMVLEKKDYFKKLYDEQGITGLTAYVSGMIARQVHSNTSTIYNKYKRDHKRFVHVSEQTWWDFYNTGKMLQFLDDYCTTETDDEIIKRNIENGIYDE